MASDQSIDFGDMPVFMGCTGSGVGSDILWNMRWGLSDGGLLTVLNPPPIELVYPDQHLEPGVSNLWMRHHKSFADFFDEYSDSNDVLEIGAAHGMLASLIEESTPGRYNWLIIEPNPVNIENTPATIIQGWFPEALPIDVAIWPTIVSSHVLEHALDSYQFLAQCSSIQEVGDQLIISWPDMEKMAARTDLNMLNFEHLHYLPSETVINMLKSLGYEVEIAYEFEGHSIFLSARKKSSASNIEPFKNSQDESLIDLAGRYKQTLNETVASFNEMSCDWSGEIWLFGAHIFSQFLISAGLDTSRISGLLDNAPSKIGQRLYGTDLYVTSPLELTHKSNQLILLAAALYEKEIIQQFETLGLSDSIILSSLSGKIILN